MPSGGRNWPSWSTASAGGFRKRRVVALVDRRRQDDGWLARELGRHPCLPLAEAGGRGGAAGPAPTGQHAAAQTWPAMHDRIEQVWQTLPWNSEEGSIEHDQRPQQNLPSKADVERALADFADPETGGSVIENSQVRDLRVDGRRVSLGLAPSTHSAPLWNETRDALAAMLKRGFRP